MALIYMLAIGLATATAVRVGNAVGRGDRPALARAGWVGLGLGILIMVALMPVLYGSSGRSSGSTPSLRGRRDRRAWPGDRAWILVVDASQGILTGALRGAADIWAALAIQFVSFWLICSRPAIARARLGYGMPGLLYGLLLGSWSRPCCWSPASSALPPARSGRSEALCRARRR